MRCKASACRWETGSATMAWNGYRHLEAYYAVSGSGAVLHTLNPRLFPEQIAYITNHAEDQYLMFELTFLPLIEAVAQHCKTIKGYILMCDRDRMPAQSGIPNLMCYEDLIDNHSDDYEWPLFDENSASSLCYTSGTTGNPKGALYSHRSTLLHSYASTMPDALNVSGRDAVLPVVPMFHVNAWGLPYSVPLTGAKMVFPGPSLDGKSLYELFEAEKVTFSAGVPTVWLGLLNHVAQNNLSFSTFKRTVIGGSACPPAMMKTLRHKYGIEVVHAWGMTEMSPLGTCATLQSRHEALPEEAPAGHPRKAGPRDFRRRHEDRRRRRQGIAVGRQDLRQPAGQGAMGHPGIFQGRGRRRPRRTAGSRPATSPP